MSSTDKQGSSLGSFPTFPPLIPTLIGLRAFDLVSRRVWWEAATNTCLLVPTYNLPNDSLTASRESYFMLHHLKLYLYLVRYIGPAVRVFINGPGDLGSIPGRVIPKTLKMELDTTLLNTQHYKVRFKGKVEQSREWSSALPYTLV